MDLTPIETQDSTTITSRLNWLRAGVLGANDGIVSTASIIFGVAGAASGRSTLVLSGIAAVAAGAMSMATGEYVSVSSQKDVEEAELAREKADLEQNPIREFKRLREMLKQRGIDHDLAHQVARQLSEEDALSAHAKLGLGIDPDSVINPWHAAFASMVAFTLGGIIPVVAVLLSREDLEIWVSGAAVAFALLLSGAISAWLGGTSLVKSIIRTVIGGMLGMAITFGVGRIAGTHV